MTAVEEEHTAGRVNDATPDVDEPHRRRRGLVWLAIGAIVLAVGAGAWLRTSSGTTEPASAAAAPVATTVVERGSISATETWSGTLGHGTPFTVNSSADGIVTRLPYQGETVESGDELYRVNEQPVTLLYGQVPMYRDLRVGDTGVDVEQLEANLAELGYDGFTADNEYTSDTAEAVRAWQADNGAAETGNVSQTGVVFLPEGRRVDALHTKVGDRVAPGIPILDITGPDQIVSLETGIADRDLINVDTAVTVALSDGDEVSGTVNATAVAEAALDDSGAGFEGGGAEPESIVQVEITLAEQVSDELVGASVDVIVAIDERADVLLVPVNALLALAEGGYGLEVVHDDGTTEIVPVDTGLFADGRVQVNGDEIAEGTVVGTAGR